MFDITTGARHYGDEPSTDQIYVHMYNCWFCFCFLSELLPSLPSYATNLRQDNNSPVRQEEPVSMAMPENVAVSSCFVEVDGPAGTQSYSAAPRGILKHLSTDSTTDSLTPHVEPERSVSPDSPDETSIDRKQVRFSTMVGQTGVEWQDGKELGEHGLLDAIFNPPFQTDNNTDPGTRRLLLKQGHMDSQQGDLIYKTLQNQVAVQHQWTSTNQPTDLV